jgi:hypothetical protein
VRRPGSGTRRGVTRGLAAGALLLIATAVSAAGWGGITPGETLRREVEARYGRPSRERTVTEGNLTGSEWLYSGDRAPRGLERMVVGFGLVRPQGFAPDVVRSLVLFPKPNVFPVATITDGFGLPDAVGSDDEQNRPLFRYDTRAIVVILNRTGEWAETIVFAPEAATVGR